MKSKATPIVCLVVATLAFVSPLQAGTQKAAARKAAAEVALVAALHAVSPDPLGGRLGLDLAEARTPRVEVARQLRGPSAPTVSAVTPASDAAKQPTKKT